MILTKGQKEYSKYVPVRKAENIFSFTNAANSGETTQVDCIRNKNKLFFFFPPNTYYNFQGYCCWDLEKK